MILLSLNKLKELNNKNPNLNWNNLSNHPNLTIEWLKEFPDKKWSWFYGISQHPNLTIEWLKEFPDKNWNWYDNLSSHTNLTIEWLKEFPDKKWNWEKDYYTDIKLNIQKHKNLTIEWLKVIPKKYWDFEILSSHPNLTIEWLQKYPDKGWDWEIINMEKLTVNYIQMWYKNMKNKEKYWKYLEYYESQRMHPEGNYIKNMIINFDK